MSCFSYCVDTHDGRIHGDANELQGDANQFQGDANQFQPGAIDIGRDAILSNCLTMNIDGRAKHLQPVENRFQGLAMLIRGDDLEGDGPANHDAIAANVPGLRIGTSIALP